MIFVPLALGVALGLAGVIPEKLAPWAGRIAMAGLAVLLFTMGAGIGTDGQLLDNLPVMGTQALILALAAAGGSIVLVWLWERLLSRRGEK
ncbi:MAG: LysO family transporter [Chloroflexi bacterium]|nr:LysO family transporter [Chloroflexota bacterium]